MALLEVNPFPRLNSIRKRCRSSFATALHSVGREALVQEMANGNLGRLVAGKVEWSLVTSAATEEGDGVALCLPPHSRTFREVV